MVTSLYKKTCHSSALLFFSIYFFSLLPVTFFQLYLLGSFVSQLYLQIFVCIFHSPGTNYRSHISGCTLSGDHWSCDLERGFFPLVCTSAVDTLGEILDAVGEAQTLDWFWCTHVVFLLMPDFVIHEFHRIGGKSHITVLQLIYNRCLPNTSIYCLCHLTGILRFQSIPLKSKQTDPILSRIFLLDAEWCCNPLIICWIGIYFGTK